MKTFQNVDHINENECLVVGLKHTFPDLEERENKMNSLIGQSIDLLADPENVKDHLSILCLYHGKKIGYIACEFCRKFYNHLDYEGRGKARVVRKGTHTCLIVRPEPFNFPRDLSVQFPLEDDDHDVPFSDHEQNLEHSHRYLMTAKETYVSMLMHDYDYSREEWAHYMQNLLRCLQNFANDFMPSPCIEDREWLHDVISFCDSALKKFEWMQPKSPLLAQLREVDHQLQQHMICCLGNEQYISVVKQHYNCFLQQSLTYHYAERYLRSLQEELSEQPTVPELKAERLRTIRKLREIDTRRADFNEFDDISLMSDFIFYARLTRKELYLFYKYMFRVSLLNRWIQMATVGKEIVVEIKVYGGADIRIEKECSNRFIFESGSMNEINTI